VVSGYLHPPLIVTNARSKKLYPHPSNLCHNNVGTYHVESGNSILLHEQVKKVFIHKPAACAVII
jgi:hypothetical protein